LLCVVGFFVAFGVVVGFLLVAVLPDVASSSPSPLSPLETTTMSTPSSFLFKHSSRNERTHDDNTQKEENALSFSLSLPLVVVRSSLGRTNNGKKRE